MNIYYLINKIFFMHKYKVGGRLHKLKCKIYYKIKNCPHCKKSYWEKNKKGEDFKISWVECPCCGYVFCTDCLFWINGVGSCPKCKEKKCKNFKKRRKNNEKR